MEDLVQGLFEVLFEVLAETFSTIAEESVMRINELGSKFNYPDIISVDDKLTELNLSDYKKGN